jgi:hypothetical protein
MWGGHILCTMLLVQLTQALRDKYLDRLTQQLLRCIAEELLGLAVNEPDTTTAVHYHSSIRSQLHQRLKSKRNISAVTWSRLRGSGLGRDGRIGGAQVAFSGAHHEAILSCQ